MTTGFVIFAIMSVLNIAGALLIVLALFSDELENMNKMCKLALMLAAFSLVWQSIKNTSLLIAGIPISGEIPFWYLKDLSWVIIGLYFGYLIKNKQLTVKESRGVI